MNSKVGAALRRLCLFVTVCSLGMFGLLAVFAELRFDDRVVYSADFDDVSGLEAGNFVRIAGVEVGKVKDISLNPDATVHVVFTTDTTVMLTHGTRAAVRYENLVGDRYLELLEGAGDLTRLTPGQSIALANTEAALDLDALIGGFRPLFRALNPDQVNTLTAQLISTFQGEGANIASMLTQISTLMGSLADRYELIGQVITNLNTVIETFGGQAEQLDRAVNSVSQLVDGLTDRKDDITNAIAYGDAAATTITDLLQRGRPAMQNTVTQTGRVAGQVMADHDYVANVLATLPDSYKVLARQGLYGDFFSFYPCEIILKVNGKGGQPTYVQVARQTTGRCTPR